MSIAHQIRSPSAAKRKPAAPKKAKPATKKTPAATQAKTRIGIFTEHDSLDIRKWAADQILSKRYTPFVGTVGAVATPPPMETVIEEAEALAQYVATGKVPEK